MAATLKDFLEECHTLGLIRLIVTSDAGVLEARVNIEKLFYAELPKGKYANMHSEHIEFHLNMDKITDVRFETGEAKRGNFTTYAIRFLDADDKAQMSAFLQWGKPGEYAEGQVEAWAALKDKYGETWKPVPVESEYTEPIKTEPVNTKRGNTEQILNFYLKEQNENFYPKILIPSSIRKALTAKPDMKETERFGEISFLAGALGVASLFTPIGWVGLLGAGAAILYDSTEGYRERDIETQKENQKAQEILSNADAMQQYMQSSLADALNSTNSNLEGSDARLGRYDSTLLNALKNIPECVVKSGEGLNLGYTFTPDVIIHIPSLNLWIDVEVDEPWFLNDLGQKQAIHYVGKDRYRDTSFLNANWVVIRFAEEQVAKQANSCAKEIADFLTLFNMNAYQKFHDVTNLKRVKCWDEQEAPTIPRY